MGDSYLLHGENARLLQPDLRADFDVTSLVIEPFVRLFELLQEASIRFAAGVYNLGLSLDLGQLQHLPAERAHPIVGRLECEYLRTWNVIVEIWAKTFPTHACMAGAWF